MVPVSFFFPGLSRNWEGLKLGPSEIFLKKTIHTHSLPRKVSHLDMRDDLATQTNTGQKSPLRNDIFSWECNATLLLAVVILFIAIFR